MLLSALPSGTNFVPRYGFRFTAFLIAFTLLTACESDTTGLLPLSLEEAKQVATEFQEVSYTPPARSINDIIKQFGPPSELKTGRCTEDSLNRARESLFDWKIPLKRLIRTRYYFPAREAEGD